MGRAAMQPGERSLLWSKLKLVYTRLTLTRYTTLYFGLAFLTCAVLVSFQSVTLSINSEAASLTSLIVETANLNEFLPIVQDGVLKLCDAVPGQPGAKCWIADVDGGDFSARRQNTTASWHQSRSLHLSKIFGSDGDLVGIVIDQGSEGVRSIDIRCVQSLTWLNDIFRDDKREDVVTLVFHIWLFALSFFTLLNESIPHLGASLASHVLVTGWAAFRVYSTSKLRRTYNTSVVGDSCSGYDVLGGWWDTRIHHAYPVLAFNVLFLGAMAFVAIQLFRSYSRQSFGRVGASEEIQKALKLVLGLSVLLHLSGFFTLASAAIWVDKIQNDVIRYTATHAKLYLAAFIVVAVLEIPRGYLGWISVRRESRALFISFMALALFLLTVSSLMFASTLYRYVFHTWSFFATITVAAYILAAGCTALGLVCWFHVQGKGLAHFLEVEKALGDANFAPAYFTRDARDVEEASKADSRNTWLVNLSMPQKAQLRPSADEDDDKYTSIAMHRQHSFKSSFLNLEEPQHGIRSISPRWS